MRKPDCKIGVFACSDASFGAKVPWGVPLGTDVPCSTPMLTPKPDPKGEQIQSFVTPHARWLCATDDEVFLIELLLAIDAIGAKRNLGYGLVDSWSFVKAHDFTARDCLVYNERTLRSLPVAWSSLERPVLSSFGASSVLDAQKHGWRRQSAPAFHAGERCTGGGTVKVWEYGARMLLDKNDLLERAEKCAEYEGSDLLYYLTRAIERSVVMTEDRILHEEMDRK